MGSLMMQCTLAHVRFQTSSMATGAFGGEEGIYR